MKKKIVKKAIKKTAKITPKKKTGKKPIKKVSRTKSARKTVGKAPGKAPVSAPEKKAPVSAPEKKAPPKPAAPREERRAHGFYDGVLVCENPKVFPPKTPYSKKEMESLHALLLRERTRLREVLRDLDQLTFNTGEESSGAMPGYSIHLAEDATRNVDTETALLLRRDEEGALRQVEAAIERLTNDVYGVCVGCGSKIGIQRLKAVPETHLCMTCKKTYDKSSGNL